MILRAPRAVLLWAPVFAVALGACARPGRPLAPPVERTGEQELDRRCRAADADACVTLGFRRVLHGGAAAGDESVQGIFRRAVNVYRASCDREIARACGVLGFLLSAGLGAARDDASGVTLLGKSCDRGDANGCEWLANMVHEGRAGPPDDARAIALFRKSCRAGAPNACNTLGRLYETGDGAPRDEVEALEMFRAACAGGLRAGCSNVDRLIPRARAGSASAAPADAPDGAPPVANPPNDGLRWRP